MSSLLRLPAALRWHLVATARYRSYATVNRSQVNSRQSNSRHAVGSSGGSAARAGRAGTANESKQRPMKKQTTSFTQPSAANKSNRQRPRPAAFEGLAEVQSARRKPGAQKPNHKKAGKADNGKARAASKPSEPGYVKLFPEAQEIHSQIANQCELLQLPLVCDTNISQLEGGKYSCSMQVKVADVFEDTIRAEGKTKEAAKTAAWVAMLPSMQNKGLLTLLFDKERTKVAADKVDKATLKTEKDATVDVFNFAASLGTLPEFTVHTYQPPRPPTTRRGFIAKKPKLLYRVRIRLPSLGIDANAFRHDLASAHIAAALKFKDQASKRPDEIQKAREASAAFQCLNVDTAGLFFDYCRDHGELIRFEMDHESAGRLGGEGTQVVVTIDGKQMGRPVYFSSKKIAVNLATLAAAVDFAIAKPEVLVGFQKALQQGRGQILRPVNPVDFPLNQAVLDTMRDAVMEARRAGLPSKVKRLDADDVLANDKRGPRKVMGYDERQIINADLAQRHVDFGLNPKLAELRAKKASLPMTHYRDAVISLVSNNVYSIVVGQTGSGKTTQVPQILFEDMIENQRGADCNIICTQPRRIAATSVAVRVAQERNEPLRQTVGYHVRFDAKTTTRPYGINYCTTGILLERLKHDPDGVLSSTSHILIDEVHERDINIDFLMIVLKAAIGARRRSGQSVPKVVLMSATLDTELFANYFALPDSNGEKQLCPSLSVPGRTFPVTEKHFVGIMQELTRADPGIRNVLERDPQTRDYVRVEREFVGGIPGEDEPQNDAGIDWKRRGRMAAVGEGNAAAKEKEEGLVPLALVAATVAHICKTTTDGAILVFLPGLEEITATRRLLEENRLFGLDFRNDVRFKIYPLHSSISNEDQSKVFERVPDQCRKIILSTNIAETSVTVTDVKHVVDTGKLREIRYNQETRITQLQCVWESKSNAKQRAGRAGRVADGYYYALFSKERHDSMRTIGLPEMLRSDLQTTCLSVASQSFGRSIATFLSEAIEPPSVEAVQLAIDSLKAMDAITPEEELTSLGRLLSRLPVHPTLGKMILLGVIFKCLDPMLVLGTAAEERSLFVQPLGLKKEARQVHRRWVRGTHSDHLALLEAFSEMRSLRSQFSGDTIWQWAKDNFVHMGAFRNIDRTAQQVVEVLRESRLMPPGRTQPGTYGPAEVNTNSNNKSLIKCLLLSGFYPNLAVKFSKGSYRTSTEGRIMMHPSSLNIENDRARKYDSGTLFAFSTLHKAASDDVLTMRDCTLVEPIAAALFGGPLSIEEQGGLQMDKWLPFFTQFPKHWSANRVMLDFRNAKERVLQSAFSELTKSAQDQDLFLTDMRDQFVERLVEVLELARPEQENQGFGDRVVVSTKREPEAVRSGRERFFEFKPARERSTASSRGFDDSRSTRERSTSSPRGFDDFKPTRERNTTSSRGFDDFVPRERNTGSRGFDYSRPTRDRSTASSRGFDDYRPRERNSASSRGYDDIRPTRERNTASRGFDDFGPTRERSAASSRGYDDFRPTRGRSTASSRGFDDSRATRERNTGRRSSGSWY
ncbi:P-loop containing nucleoside triphosphate hydrolase protein [Xylariomycetidae sp. FL0641]|nr:P-loop containing nucleoside triphosphate hydrolase protein [Xylariomycetidae sp. FL0641]